MIQFENLGHQSKALLLCAGAIIAMVIGAVVAMLITLAGLGRLDAEVNLSVVPHWLWYFRADPQVARWSKIGLFTSYLTVLIFAGVGVLSIRRPLHGAARWAGEVELRRADLRSSAGIVLGAFRGKLLRFGGSEHVLLYAPTRTGKGVGVVIPNLLSWPHSLIVLDVKRENWAASAGYRAAHGQAVHLFDPFSPDRQTARFNPLGHIPRQNPTATLNELQKIAAMLFPTPDRADPFWSEAARTGFVGVGALVAETPNAPFTLGEIYRQLTRENPRVRLPATIVERARAGKPLSAPCVSALTDFCAAGENTFASIKQTITSRMSLWLNPDVDWATSASDFDLGKLTARPTSVYLGVTPDNLIRAAPIYNLLLQQIIDVQTRQLPRPEDRDRQLLIVLDEFARLGHAPMLAQAFSFVAGYGIRLLAVLQSPSQLREAYGDHLADEIVANCGAEVIFAPKDIRVAQTLSERLGYLGQPSFSRSRPLGLASGRRSVTESEQRRPLMLPQELIGLSKNELIVLRAGSAPVRGRKLRYYRLPSFKKRVRPAPALRTADASPPSGGNENSFDGAALDSLSRSSARTSEREHPAMPPGGSSEIYRHPQAAERMIHRR